MHPQRELDRLAARKAALLGELARQREVCGMAVARLKQPLEWAERVLALGQRAMPLLRNLAASQPGRPRPTGSVSWLRWLPFAFSAANLALRFRKRQSGDGAAPS